MTEAQFTEIKALLLSNEAAIMRVADSLDKVIQSQANVEKNVQDVVTQVEPMMSKLSGSMFGSLFGM